MKDNLRIFFVAMSLFLFGSQVHAEPIKIVVLGDSLVAGYQLAAGDGFPEKLHKSLSERGRQIEVINAGVSGDTSSGGLSRLDWSVGPDTDAVILELGANDALRGISPDATRKNLDAIVQRLKSRNIEVLIAGMLAPRNLGPEYAAAFDPIYKELSEQYDALYYPFFLEGVALDPKLNLADGMHPNEKGVEVIVQNILPHVEALLDRVQNAS